ncbi:MAG: hypothetical protein M3292_04170, partial [Actinomycetota bacterium]|nr:hypothetical protein [Actinomycetota bacterium]
MTPARELGAKAFRITLVWSPGQTTLAPTDAGNLDRAVQAASGMRIVLAVYADSPSKAPLDAAARDQYCAYARSAVERRPEINDVVIWNEPNLSYFWAPQFDANGQSAAPAAYEALLARCWDVLHAYRASINVVAPATSPRGNDNPSAPSNISHSPGNFIRKLGEAYRASGRQLPILDTVGQHVYGESPSERPWRQHIGSKTMAEGDWNKLMWSLATAFAGTGQRIPGECSGARCVSILYLEAGFQTVADAHKASLYSGPEPAGIPDDAGGEPAASTPSADSPAPDQSTQITDAVRLAYCQPYVEAFFNFLLWDETTATGWQSGPFWADRTPKDSWPAFREAIGEANSGTVNCAALKGGPPSADYTPPSSVTAISISAARDPLRVELAWSPSSDAAGPVKGYRVYRNGGYYAWTETPAFRDAKVAQGTPYSYTVYAQDVAGNLSDVSETAAITTPDFTPPTAPSGLSAQILQNPGRVSLSWTASTDNAAVVGYRVSRDAVPLGEAQTTSYTDASATGPASYTYSIEAYDAAGNVSAAATIAVTTPDLAAPSAPRRLVAHASRRPPAVVLRWSASSDNIGVRGYRISRDGVLLGETTATTYTDASPARVATATYSVQAYDAAGNMSAPATVAAWADLLAPSAPRNLRASVSRRPLKVLLRWRASRDNVVVAGYRVYRNAVRIARARRTTYTDATVSARTTYTYV